MALREVIMTAVGALNDEKLDADLRLVCPHYTGFSRRPGVNGIILLFEPPVDDPEIATAQTTVTTHDPQTLTANQQARKDLVTALQTCVGVGYVDLTTAQLKALLAALLFESGGLADDLTVKPLNQWIDR